jgi:uncharacterized membrane protein YqjE
MPRKRKKWWTAWLQQVGVFILVVAIVQWRRRVQNAHDKRLLTYLLGSIGVAWSIHQVRAKPSKE